MLLVIIVKKNSINRVYFATFFLFLVDFIIKRIVVTKVSLLKSIVVIPSFFNITYIQNRGAAWGIFDGNSTLLAILSLIIFIIISSYAKKIRNMSNISMIAFSFLLGGILGNFIDRVLYGYVIDFLDFKIFGYNYPVFNFADILIVVGTIIILIQVLRGELHEDRGR